MGTQVYQVVTNRVIELLERGVVPWRKPWAGYEQAPKNLISSKPYRGINVFLLSCAGYASPHWLTYKQAKDRGGHVRKGERSTLVVFFKPWETGKKDDQGKSITVPLLRYYKLFNTDQCDDVDAPAIELPANDFQPIDRCVSVVEGMPKPPIIRNGESRAYYQPGADLVNMPVPESFEWAEAYYSTLFHELTHSTGHRSRLDRPEIRESHGFGSTCYSREELVAEFGAAFLDGYCGIEAATIENSAAYLAGWLGRLREDPKLIVQAASKAQRAADFILGREGQTDN